MRDRHILRRNAKTAALIAGLASFAVTTFADGPGRSFTSLESPFRQELFGLTSGPVVNEDANGFLGAVAFAPDGDVWTSECGHGGSRLHRFDRQNASPHVSGTLAHDESLADLSGYAGATGCGMVNHPDGAFGSATIFANTSTGLWPIDPDGGFPILGGPINSSIFSGNGQGIAVDPVSNHVVYVARDCDSSVSPGSSACTLWDYDAATFSTTVFARITRSASESFDTLYFSPNGDAALVSYRDTSTGSRGLAVISRPAALRHRSSPADDAQLTQRVQMTSQPSGVAFHTTGFAITLDESGSMTKLVFPDVNFTEAPTQTLFASGGFRGGLLQVGADGCVYAPQGRLLETGGTDGVRFNNGTTASSDSVVRICGGFVPAAGVLGPWSELDPQPDPEPEPGSISGFAYADWNKNGVKDGAEPGLNGAPLALTDAQGGSTPTATGADGVYRFDDVSAGSYLLSAVASNAAAAGLSASPIAVTLSAGEQRTGVNLGYSEAAAPFCSAVVQSGSPTTVVFSVNDAESGLKRIQLTAVSNFSVVVNGGAAVTAPATVTFASPVAGDVVVAATRVNADASASVTLQATDVFGNVKSCVSPAVAATPAPPPPPPTGGGKVIREVLRGFGRDHVEVLDNVSQSMRYVTIHNKRPGLLRVDLLVNKKRYRATLWNDRDHTVKLDISAALELGKKNKIVLVGWGFWRGEAVVTIADKK